MEQKQSQFICPYTAPCRLKALDELKDMPDLLALVEGREHCTERDGQRAHRCAVRLGLVANNEEAAAEHASLDNPRRF